MSRIYWDTMLFIYWLEDKEPYSRRIEEIRNRMEERGDTLCTSVFTLGELLVGPRKQADSELEKLISDYLNGPDVELLPFDVKAVDRYSRIRANGNVKPADAIHLACASAAGVDMFLTHDDNMRKQIVPGIQFIDGLETSVFGD